MTSIVAATVAGVGGTTEANGTWPIDVIDGTHVELNGSTFVHAYTAGGTITGLASIEPIETDPVVEISWSDDGGQTYYAPIQRKLGRSRRSDLVDYVLERGLVEPAEVPGAG